MPTFMQVKEFAENPKYSVPKINWKKTTNATARIKDLNASVDAGEQGSNSYSLFHQMVEDVLVHLGKHNDATPKEEMRTSESGINLDK